jgi:glycosyltransferase involved in cell wall biosynthesis
MDSQTKPLVSVVTPVYNGAKYLSECIESVLAQSYDNWEYIIVNNCSTDGSFEIAQRYAKQDPRLRIHNNQQFVGVIENHNIAFCQISPGSKYCKVVQADDWLFPECLREMVNIAEAHPSVGIVGAYRLHGDRVCSDGLPYPSTVVSGRDICRFQLLGGPYIFGSPTSHLIRSDLIQGREAFYNSANLHADTEVCFKILQDADFGFVHQVLTYSRKHTEAISSLSARFKTYVLSNLLILTKYGPHYLNDEEYEERLENYIQKYYKLLGRSILHMQGKKFLEFHRTGLMDIGYTLSTSKIVLALLSEITDYLFNPKSTLKKIRVCPRYPS